MKGAKGDTGDAGLPGEAVNKTYPIIHSYQCNQLCKAPVEAALQFSL